MIDIDNLNLHSYEDIDKEERMLRNRLERIRKYKQNTTNFREEEHSHKYNYLIGETLIVERTHDDKSYGKSVYHITDITVEKSGRPSFMCNMFFYLKFTHPHKGVKVEKQKDKTIFESTLYKREGDDLIPRYTVSSETYDDTYMSLLNEVFNILERL